MHLQARQTTVATTTYNQSQVVISTSQLLFPAAVAWMPQAHHQASSHKLVQNLQFSPQACCWHCFLQAQHSQHSAPEMGACSAKVETHNTSHTALSTGLRWCQVRKVWRYDEGETPVLAIQQVNRKGNSCNPPRVWGWGIKARIITTPEEFHRIMFDLWKKPTPTSYWRIIIKKW